GCAVVGLRVAVAAEPRAAAATGWCTRGRLSRLGVCGAGDRLMCGRRAARGTRAASNSFVILNLFQDPFRPLRRALRPGPATLRGRAPPLTPRVERDGS